MPSPSDAVHLNSYDLAVFTVYMIVTLGVGFWAARQAVETQGVLPRRQNHALVRRRRLDGVDQHFLRAFHRECRRRV